MTLESCPLTSMCGLAFTCIIYNIYTHSNRNKKFKFTKYMGTSSAVVFLHRTEVYWLVLLFHENHYFFFFKCKDTVLMIWEFY